MSPSEPLLNTEGVAGLLQVHPKHVYRLLRRGLPGHRVGGEWRFARTEVLRWVEGGGLAPVAGSVEDAGRPRGADMAGLGPAIAATMAALVAANGDVAVELLLARVNAAAPPLLGFVPADRDTAMAMLRAGQVLAAGCHAKGPPSHIDGARLARIHLVSRDVGLVGRVGEPAPAIATLAGRRIAGRPASAGVRLHLDDAITRAGGDPAAVLAGAIPYASHRDAVLAVVRGDADVALATSAWADRAGLPFTSLATEAYGLVVRAADLGDPRVVRMCEVAQSPAYRRELGAVPGYDADGAGAIRYDADGIG
jgi:excisionase family DNA binding protein